MKFDQKLLQKFTSKIEQLMQNRQSQHSQDQSERNQKQANAPMSALSEQPSESQENNSNQDFGNKNQQNAELKRKNAINLDQEEQDQDDPSKSQKIDSKQLLRLVALQKKKAQQKRANNATNNSSGPSTIRKTTPGSKANQLGPSPSQNNVVQNPKERMMPKVATMNNLIKLSTKLDKKQILRQIKYKAQQIGLGPTRLLLYFSVQRILYYIYQNNGVQKINQRIKDTNFMVKQITQGLIDLLKLLKTSEKTMLIRILDSVFKRLGLSQLYSNKWLTDCVRANKQAFSSIGGGVNYEQLEAPPANSNITANIFIGIPNVTSKINYDYLNIDLEDESLCNERIQDPEVYHLDQKLFFFKEKPKKSAVRSGNNDKNIRNKNQKSSYVQSIQLSSNENNYNNDNYDNNDEYNDSDNTKPSKFSIQLIKADVPLNAKIYSNPKNHSNYETYKPLKQQKSSKIDDSKQIVPKKRNRQSNINQNFQQEFKVQDRQNIQSVFTKQKIIKIIDEYFLTNIDEISHKIAHKLNINPQKLRKLLKQSDQTNSAPAKKAVPQVQDNKEKKKPEDDNSIVDQILAKQGELQRKNTGRKDIVKEVILFLESKKLDEKRKEKILNKWIQIKKQKQSKNSR